ncbi:hypothetical protein chiPu_0011878 [Chiloscyllium punctatum]|uniref:Uncharacterized protein n=1 Tax=Chiloscyllium punctatum TaxID=137246 RepID=A0A401SSN9_CHIPU|nr:hypothetical protein [Chiloscyllium punctatum]
MSLNAATKAPGRPRTGRSARRRRAGPAPGGQRAGAEQAPHREDSPHVLGGHLDWAVSAQAQSMPRTGWTPGPGGQRAGAEHAPHRVVTAQAQSMPRTGRTPGVGGQRVYAVPARELCG